MKLKRAVGRLVMLGRRAIPPFALLAALPVHAQSVPATGVNDPGSAPVIDRERADRLEPRIAPPPALPVAPAPPASLRPREPRASG